MQFAGTAATTTTTTAAATAGRTAMDWAQFGAIIGAGVLQASAQRNLGKLQEQRYKEQADQELSASRDREIERRRRLISALASQSAEGGVLAAAPGVGSRAAIAMADAKRAGYEGLADRATTGRRSLLLRRAGKEARKQGNVAALGTVLGTARDALAAYP